MITAPLPLTGAEPPYLVCVPHPDGTAILYEPGDPLPADLSAPPPQQPAITARQIRLALTARGLRDAVEAAVAAGPRDLRDWWEFSIEIHRDHPLVAEMIAAIGATPEQADAVWALGATL